MRLYTAGPMRNRPYYNAVAFEEAAALLRKQGHDVVSPVDLDRDLGINVIDCPEGTEDTGHDLSELMLRDLAEVTRCDAVVTLDGHEHSTGSAVEVAYARFLGLPVYHIKEFR